MPVLATRSSASTWAAPAYGGGERREKTKLVLERLEAALGHKEKIDPASLTIEHVMPQTLTPWWQEHLGEDWEDDHETLLHTLGNLTLTGYNSELSNQSYPEKQKVLGDSHFELNRYFTGVERWNAGEIQQRADTLTDLALTVWPYFGPARVTAAGPEEPDVTMTLPRTVTFRGTERRVRSWAEVLLETLEIIVAEGPDEYAKVEAVLGRVVNRDPTALRRLRRPRRISNGAYIDVNRSASAIHALCVQALEIVGLGPDEWRVDYVSLAGEGDDEAAEPPTTIKQQQLELWQEVRAALAASSKFPQLRIPRPRYWFDIALGRAGFWLSLNANMLHGKLIVKLMMDEEQSPALSALAADKGPIEAAIGSPLEWDPHPEKKFRSIRLVHPLPIANREHWPHAIAWLTKTAIAFKDAFSSRIADLDV